MNFQQVKPLARQTLNKVIFLLLFLGILPACTQPPLPAKPMVAMPLTATTTLASSPSPSPSPSPAQTSTPTADTSTTRSVRTATITPINAQKVCAANPITSRILQDASAARWLDWVKKLSGAEPVKVGGIETRFSTRYTPAMFSTPGPNALDFVQETIAGWYPKNQISIQSFTAAVNDKTLQGKNLILTIPGTDKKNEVVILSAHLDSISQVTPEKTAPGAEDNASGSAALLEAARLLRDHQFERTIRIIWFTGEEQGMLGSKAYVKELKNPGEIQAVINLDMFGFDSDGDRCFEMHVGTLPASKRVGQCFLESITAYDLGLPHPDYLTDNATSSSDHGSFWAVNVGAIEILENMFDQKQPGGCSTADKNIRYHTPQDTYDRLNPDLAIRIVRTGLATLLAFAGPIQ